MSTVQPTDKTLVNRAGVDHSASADMSTVQDTDLLLINRAGVDYKCTFADWKASQKSVVTPSITSPSDGAGQIITPQSDVITAVGGTAAQPVLTFATTKDLAKFRVGDFVINNGMEPIRYGTLPGGASYPTPTDTLTLIGAANLNTTSTSAQAIADNPHPAGGSAEQLVIDMIDGTTDVTIQCNSINWRVNHSNSLSGPWTAVTGLSNFNTPVALRGHIGSSRYVIISYTPRGNWSFYAFNITLAASWVTAFGKLSVGPYADGTIKAIDITAKTITLERVSGSWTANTGSFVIGTPSLSAGAALGETPTFTSSAFAGTGTTHVSSDWQVTRATDPTFASPVVQSMADATNKVRWDGGPLQANTDYIVRVRHNGTGISSAWSAVVTFKTKTTFP